MNQKNSGGPAFPISDQAAHSIAAYVIEGIVDTAERDRMYLAARAQAQQGMTLRDYFAAKAMQGICAHNDTWGLPNKEIGIEAYKIADAMLEARGTA